MSANDRVLARYAALANDDAPTPAPRVAAPELTPAHLEVVNLLDELITLGEQHAPPGLQLVTRALRRLEPALLEQFGSVDPALVVEFLHRLGHRFLAVNAEGSSDGTEPRASQSA